jgi:proline iminopeptidase
MYLAGEFHRLAEGRTLILYDQRARGKSDAVTDSGSIGLIYEVSDLEAIRQGLGFERISLIGWSYSGFVVAKYALEYRKYIERVIQVGPLPPCKIPYWARTLKELSSRRSPDEIARIEHLIQLSNNSEEPVDLIRDYYKVAHKAIFYGPIVETRFRDDFYTLPNEVPHNVWSFHLPTVISSLGNWDLRKDLEGFDVPLLTIHGDYDYIPMESAREWAKLVQDGRLLVVPEAGHLPWLEQPQIFFNAVNSFLEGDWPEDAKVVH